MLLTLDKYMEAIMTPNLALNLNNLRIATTQFNCYKHTFI